MDPQNAFGMTQLWAQSDLITRCTAVLLIVMSVVSWYLILSKGLRMLGARRHTGAIEAFWQAATIEEGLTGLDARAKGAPCTHMAHQAAAAHAHCTRHAADATLGSTLDVGEFVTRALRRAIAQATEMLERGLTVLASIGSTAPFIGLFGTVWGIYHALTTISVTGAASIDKVAGPVGEALIMTAFGLFVAIPAVLAYNGFSRANRIELSELDGFAHDLHAFFTTGARVGATTRTSAGRPAPRAASNTEVA